jgi:glucokinase
MSAAAADAIFLLADVGGTHTRAALKRADAPPERIRLFNNREFESLEALLKHYLADMPPITGAALAIASAAEGDQVSLTNIDWTFSIQKLRERLSVEWLRVFNDFTAIALALPTLADDQREKIGEGVARADAALAVLGPGTGLGVSGMIPCGDSWAPLSGEGGHATLAATTEEESELLALLRPKLKHVSAEKLLSGPGIIELHQGLARLHGAAVETVEAETITARALDAGNPLAVDALALFFAFLGGFAGNVALTLGARGGIYLAGGMLPNLIEPLRRSAFRERFAAKGRFRGYLEAIPTYVVTDPYPGLAGLGAWLDDVMANG